MTTQIKTTKKAAKKVAVILTRAQHDKIKLDEQDFPARTYCGSHVSGSLDDRNNDNSTKKINTMKNNYEYLIGLVLSALLGAVTMAYFLYFALY